MAIGFSMAGETARCFEEGDLVRLRGREWAVESSPDDASVLQAFDLACIDDDAQGERLRAILEAELDLSRVEDDAWQRIGESGPIIPRYLQPTCAL